MHLRTCAPAASCSFPFVGCTDENRVRARRVHARSIRKPIDFGARGRIPD